jgi:leader peptidase (prepilin peptidase)/N-methyltransferase
MEAYLQILVFVFGTAIGSFLNAAIYRLPQGFSLIRPGSFCPACRKPIRFYDNIPLISYLILRGRCRSCGGIISPRYPLVEAVSGLITLALYLKWGLGGSFWVFWVFSEVLLLITFIDLDVQIIPDYLSLPGIGAGILASFFIPEMRVLDSLAGVLLGGGVLWGIAFLYEKLTGREGMGGGDIKLLAMVGAFLGWKGALFSLMGGAFLGSLVGLVMMLFQGKEKTYAIPFGPFLSLGALGFVFWGNVLIEKYFMLVYG